MTDNEQLNSLKLPLPSAIAAKHCEQVKGYIAQEIQQQGPISFARFMEIALYQPGLGYYSAGSQKFGPQGDFVTAAEISPLFGQCLAAQCQQVLADLNQGDILEFGPGSGALAAEILLALEQKDQLPSHYYFLELSADLKQRQQQTMEQRCPHLIARCQWLDKLPDNFIGCIIANEVLDAMPVECFSLQDDNLLQRTVALDNEQFIWQTKKADDQLSAAVTTLGPLPYPYQSEVNLHIEPWLNSLSQCLEQGVILLIDYGFPQREYYHPERNMGTLMCHYRHHSHTEPLLIPGLQDITSHVNFTAVAKAAMDCSLDVAGFCNQASFLISCGLLQLFQAMDTQQDLLLHQKIHNQIQQLTSPSEMGELFKVLALSKNFQQPLLGFEFQDSRHRL